jgi:hypothetical protein
MSDQGDRLQPESRPVSGFNRSVMAAAEGLTFRAILTAPDLGFDYEGA